MKTGDSADELRTPGFFELYTPGLLLMGLVGAAGFFGVMEFNRYFDVFVRHLPGGLDTWTDHLLHLLGFVLARPVEVFLNGFLLGDEVRFGGFLLLFLAVVSLTGVPLARYYAHLLCRDEKPDVSRTYRISSGMIWTVFQTGLMALGLMAILWLFIFFWGVFLRWDLLAVFPLLLLPVGFFIGFLYVLLFSGTIAGFPLIIGCAASEWTGPIDALSRGLVYLFTYPWKYIYLHLKTFIFGVFGGLPVIALVVAGLYYADPVLLKEGVVAAGAGLFFPYIIYRCVRVYLILRRDIDGIPTREMFEMQDHSGKGEQGSEGTETGEASEEERNIDDNRKREAGYESYLSGTFRDFPSLSHWSLRLPSLVAGALYLLLAGTASFLVALIIRGGQPFIAVEGRQTLQVIDSVHFSLVIESLLENVQAFYISPLLLEGSPAYAIGWLLFSSFFFYAGWCFTGSFMARINLTPLLSERRDTMKGAYLWASRHFTGALTRFFPYGGPAVFLIVIAWSVYRYEMVGSLMAYVIFATAVFLLIYGAGPAFAAPMIESGEEDERDTSMDAEATGPQNQTEPLYSLVFWGSILGLGFLSTIVVLYFCLGMKLFVAQAEKIATGGSYPPFGIGLEVGSGAIHHYIFASIATFWQGLLELTALAYPLCFLLNGSILYALYNRLRKRGIPLIAFFGHPPEGAGTNGGASSGES